MSLKELLGEELYNQVIEKAGDSKLAIVSDGNWFPKDKFDTKNQEVKDLQDELNQRDNQLRELKDVDPKALQDEIDRLEGLNETTANDYQEKLDKQAFDFSLEKALTGAKVRNATAVKSLLDTEKIKLDGDKLLNLDDQLKGLKESDPYLFEEEKKQEEHKPNFTTGQHQKGGTSTKGIADMSYQELADLKSSNPTKFAELTK